MGFYLFYLLFKELELENQDLKDRMREVQEEQRMLLDHISGLQLQLSEVNMGWIICPGSRRNHPLRADVERRARVVRTRASGLSWGLFLYAPPYRCCCLLLQRLWSGGAD